MIANNPCADHPCDRCPTCLSGTCCLTVPSSGPTLTTTITVDQVDRLRDAIAQEAESVVGLAQLIQFDVTVRCGVESAPAALPPAPEPVDIFDTSEEETQHVYAARPFR
jgi:hypothetical protein